MDILSINPADLPMDDFGPPLGGMPLEDYERWIAETIRPNRAQIELNPPPQPDGEPFVW